jgi:hypothetical protein
MLKTYAAEASPLVVVKGDAVMEVGKVLVLELRKICSCLKAPFHAAQHVSGMRLPAQGIGFFFLFFLF